MQTPEIMKKKCTLLRIIFFPYIHMIKISHIKARNESVLLNLITCFRKMDKYDKKLPINAIKYKQEFDKKYLRKKFQKCLLKSKIDLPLQPQLTNKSS